SASRNSAGKAFAGKRHGIKSTVSTEHFAVQGDPLPCFYLNGLARLHHFRMHFLIHAAAEHGSSIGTDIQQRFNTSFCTIDSRILKKLTDSIKKHHRNAFRVFADEKSPQ